jgi:hypothetical protein
MKEEFRKIPSLDFRYEVSRKGIVRNIKSKKIKKQTISKFGYYRTAYRVNKTNPHYSVHGWSRMLHQLVMECWGQPRPSEKHIIDHIDRNKLNNDISNLRWVTYSENANNTDKELIREHNSMGQRNSVKKKRCPVMLVKDGETHTFKSRFECAEWLISTNQTTTKKPCGLARRIAVQKFIHGYEIYNINAERLTQ